MENGITNAPHPERERSEQSKDALRLGPSLLRDAGCARSVNVGPLPSRSQAGGTPAFRFPQRGVNENGTTNAPHPERERSEQSKDALLLGPSVLRDATLRALLRMRLDGERHHQRPSS